MGGLSEFESFIQTRNTQDMLKLISLAKLAPSNHGKNLRLEVIQSQIINNLNTASKEFNYDGLINILQETYPSDTNEDPVETSFTENFQFKNGNNVVFPGLAVNSTSTVQLLVNAILLQENNLPIHVKQTIEEGLIFMLYTHNLIAEKLELTRYMPGTMKESELDFPTEDFYKKHIAHFEFSTHEIQEIYKRLHVSLNIIERFTFDRSVKIDIDDLDSNPILLKPFIEIDGTWLLVEPTSQMYAINQFILDVLNENDVLEEIVNIFDESVYFETRKHVRNMNWLETDITEKYREKCGFKANDMIWQFDENKFAYVYVVPNNDKSETNFHDMASSKLKLLLPELDSSIEFMTVFVLSAYSSIEPVWFAIEEIKESKYVLAINIHDLSKLVSYWDLDKLSLWKYLRAYQRATDRGMFIMPLFSILTYYKWYMRNTFSFFDTDKKVDGIGFSYDMQGEVIIKTNSKEDNHLLTYMSEKVGLGYIPVHKAETYAPIYLSEELYTGQYRKALEIFSFPLWVTCDKKRDILGRFLVDAVVYWMYEIFESFSKYVNPLAKPPIEISLVIDEKLADITSKEIENLADSAFEIDLEVVKNYRQITLFIPVEIYGALHRNDNFGERILMRAVIDGFSKLLHAFGHYEIAKEKIEDILEQGIPLGPAKMLITADSTNNLKFDNRYIPSPRYVSKADTAIVLEDLVG